MRQGGWGGTAAFLAVASRWGIDIVCWDRRRLDSRAAVRVVRPEGTQSVPLEVVRASDCCSTRCHSMLCNKHLYGLSSSGDRRRRLVHVVYNGTNHYAAMVEAGWRQKPPHHTIADADDGS